ncbi:hypothetical protein TRAPUB_1165 [Trametes pubescens]|uniref:Uncharacterized protein n=1 Tax=Trametes pubescens TaxID=154538 RepID=A0A1M2VK21_TRAPU|nr:hypothetical protein TRAPUB_1165 [Trametes pubescens]
MATELLEHLISGSSIRRTVSQDLQSFCWVIIYITFKYTAVELMAMSTSAIKEIVGFNNKNVRQEFHTLFSATSATDLVNQRKVAFRMKAGTVEHRGQALAYAGIENLYNYVKSKDVALARHLSMIWHLLKMCQPLQLTSGMDDEMEAEDMRFLRKVTGDAPVAEASSVRPSAFSITFNHADLIGVLEIGLERMGKQAAHAQST